MDRILVSACLLGSPVRYNGSDKRSGHPALERWLEEGRLVPMCPEVAAGLGAPRPPAEIEPGGTAEAVLNGEARVLDKDGGDHSATFRRGAELALALARANDCRYAILTDGSPSCGSSFIHDGGFDGRTRAGRGVVAEMLARHDIEVFAETEIDRLVERLNRQR